MTLIKAARLFREDQNHFTDEVLLSALAAFDDCFIGDDDDIAT